MVLLNVYTRNIEIKYKSFLFSKATFLVLLFEIFNIVFPFLIAYNTGGFWLKKETFYEQPRIRIQGHYILMATTNNPSSPIVCQTYPFYKKYLQQYDMCSIIKIREVDEDYDGKVEELLTEMFINLGNNTLNSLTLIMPINYSLNEVCPLEISSLILYQHNFQQETVSELQVYAHLELFQSSALTCGDRHSSHQYKHHIFENENDIKYFRPENIVSKYLERNVTTHLKNVYTVVKTDSKETFNLKLHIKYPEHKIYYKPGFWQIIKIAWIQYLAIYIILSWLSRKIKKYIFENRLVWYYEEYPLNDKEMFK